MAKKKTVKKKAVKKTAVKKKAVKKKSSKKKAAAAESLGKHKGEVYLDLDALPVSAAEILR